MLTPVTFGKTTRILADTRESAHSMAETCRDLARQREKTAALLLIGGTYYVFSGREALEATEPPEELVDELAECTDKERDYRLTNYMQMVRQRLIAAAETLDFRLYKRGHPHA